MEWRKGWLSTESGAFPLRSAFGANGIRNGKCGNNENQRAILVVSDVAVLLLILLIVFSVATFLANETTVCVISMESASHSFRLVLQPDATGFFARIGLC